MEKPDPHPGYTPSQLANYLDYIGLPESKYPPSMTLEYLTTLIQHHIATVPFDNLYLHYSPTHYPSLHPDLIYKKVVNTYKGGFCLEQNRLFGLMLKAIGFKVALRGARVHAEAGGAGPGEDWYFGWTHFVNFVWLERDIYLVDVGFGGAGPCKPLKLIEGYVTPGLGAQELRVIKEVVEAEGQKDALWIYEQRPSPKDPWAPVYAFSTVPFLPQDAAVVLHYVTTHPASWFTFRLVCMRYIMEDEQLRGMMILVNDRFYRKIGDVEETLETVTTEDQRVKALEKYFGIVLSREEKDGILGMATRLVGT